MKSGEKAGLEPNTSVYYPTLIINLSDLSSIRLVD